jgi:C4-dicarboxylate transporter/malic acid transport protein
VPLVDRIEAVATSGAVGEPSTPPGWLANFHPGWFGSIMGTGVIAVIASRDPGHVAALGDTMTDASYAAAALAGLLAVLLGIPYLARWALYPTRAWADLRDPTVGPLHGTFPGGILVLAAVAAAVGPKVLPVHSVPTVIEVLDAVGIPLALAISLVFAYLLFTLEHRDTRVVNGGWFIPPVVTIIVPVVLVPLLPQVGSPAARLLLFTGYAFWGVGFLLFLLVLSMLHDRMITHALPPAAMAPSLWIVLGPAGVGAAALVDLAHAAPLALGAKAAPIGPLSLVGAGALWGFGAWSLLVALALLGRYLRQGRVPYGLGWWGFTFPLGALTLATSSLADAWALPILGDIALGLLTLLVVLWLGVTAATLRSVANGTAWERAGRARASSTAGNAPGPAPASSQPASASASR